MDQKKKSGRFQVQCLSCGSEFNRDYKSTHEKKMHHGNLVQIKVVGAPENPFVLAAKRQKLEPERFRAEPNPSTSDNKGKF